MSHDLKQEIKELQEEMAHRLAGKNQIIKDAWADNGALIKEVSSLKEKLVEEKAQAKNGRA